MRGTLPRGNSCSIIIHLSLGRSVLGRRAHKAVLNEVEESKDIFLSGHVAKGDPNRACRLAIYQVNSASTHMALLE